MPKVTYIEFNGAEHRIEVASEMTVMQAAIDNNVPGIDADCGGACACATCHIYVDDTWIERVGSPSTTEATMLEWAKGVQPNSRLSCQITITDALDGFVVRMPESQR